MDKVYPKRCRRQCGNHISDPHVQSPQPILLRHTKSEQRSGHYEYTYGTDAADKVLIRRPIPKGGVRGTHSGQHKAADERQQRPFRPFSKSPPLFPEERSLEKQAQIWLENCKARHIHKGVQHVFRVMQNSRYEQQNNQ